jgi:GTP pyrophosphokinase
MASGGQIDLAGLEKEYRQIASLAQTFTGELGKQLLKLLESEGIALAFPMQQRVKSWDSIAGKLERLTLAVKSIQDLQDLIGLRIVPLFRRDIRRVESLIRDRLSLIREYDTSDRLKEDQFGYASKHLIVRLPSSWLAIPSFDGMGELQAEIQLRTLAQHMWAEASHVLQYKREDTVPKSMRRTLYRASAILEMVDLEFDRILSDRETYRETVDIASTDAKLDVDLLEKLLDAELPPGNKVADEGYAQLLEELRQLKIETVAQLRGLIRNHLHKALKADSAHVKGNLSLMEKGLPTQGTTRERTANGAFFTHLGLVRTMLREEFGFEKIQKLITRRFGKGK